MSEEYSRRDFLHQLYDLMPYLLLAGNTIYLNGCDKRKGQMVDKNSVKMIGNPKFDKVIVLGMDGVDPKLLAHLMNQGHLPNFHELSQRGCLSSLATSNPAQSPVAWPSIATGNNPGYHGVFDFINRRVTNYIPDLAVLKINPKNFFGKRELRFLPVMQGNSFWDYTSSLNIPSTIIRWPVTFPPKQNDAKLFSGLGVPDLKGGLGNYSFYTNKDIPRDAEGIEKVISVEIHDGSIKTYILGPQVESIRERKEAKIDIQMMIFPDHSKVELDIQGKKISVTKGTWSQWAEVKFKVGFTHTVTGIVKFFLNQVHPDFELYMTPVQINPRDPAYIISNPDNYICELAGAFGDFYTLGIPEDTKALTEGRMDEEAFITMCDEIMDIEEKIFWYELNRFKRGLLSVVFFSTDRIQHIFWVTKDPKHPLYDAAYAKKYGRVIDDYYMRMDKILGEVLKNIDHKTALVVCSDHGFSSYRRSVHLNSLLVKNGFMVLDRKVDKTDTEGGGLFQYVDWKNTQAYALGFGSIYLNLKGREKYGIIEPREQAESVMDSISKSLLKLTDPADGQPVMKNVYKSNQIYSGLQLSHAPDLVIGFHEGYRMSWQTAIGGAPYDLIVNNLKKWTGDHIVDPSIVPGIFLSNFKINSNHPTVMDIAPSVLSCFGLAVPDISGKALL